MIEVALPGTGGMMPLPSRWLSCLAIRSGGSGILFDCGEGTQIALRAAGWSLRSVDAVCISHFHADHVSGLVGILLLLANSDRTGPLVLYGPPGLSAVVAGQRLLCPYLPYDVRIVELRSGDTFAVGELLARCALGEHRAPCLAYRVDLPRRPRFSPERAQALGLPVQAWHTLQSGQPVEWAGRAVQPEEVLGPSRRGLSLVYATDTRPTAELAALAAGVDLLVCEATLGDQADQPRAVETGHMTFAEAGRLASNCGAKRLVLTHFSPALQRPEEYRQEAARDYPDVVVGHDGLRLTLSFDE